MQTRHYTAPGSNHTVPHTGYRFASSLSLAIRSCRRFAPNTWTLQGAQPTACTGLCSPLNMKGARQMPQVAPWGAYIGAARLLERREVRVRGEEAVVALVLFWVAWLSWVAVWWSGVYGAGWSGVF